MQKHEFPAYVFAHWNYDLVYTCTCGKKHKILKGVVTEDT